MSKEADNKAIVGRWFTEFWGKTCNLAVVDELAAPDIPTRGISRVVEDGATGSYSTGALNGVCADPSASTTT